MGGHPGPEMRGGGGAVLQKLFSALWSSVWSKNRRGEGQALLLDLPCKGLV